MAATIPPADPTIPADAIEDEAAFAPLIELFKPLLQESVQRLSDDLARVMARLDSLEKGQTAILTQLATPALEGGAAAGATHDAAYENLYVLIKDIQQAIALGGGVKRATRATGAANPPAAEAATAAPAEDGAEGPEGAAPAPAAAAPAPTAAAPKARTKAWTAVFGERFPEEGYRAQVLEWCRNHEAEALRVAEEATAALPAEKRQSELAKKLRLALQKNAAFVAAIKGFNAQ